jgi:hypothetical protein
MLSLTYATPAANVDQAGADFRQFRVRLLRARWWDGEAFPYLWVVEWGSKNGRLHLHLAVGDWWDRLGCVEVCARCATTGRKRKGPVAPAGSSCVGCVWGHGFVGRPNGNGEPAAVAHYAAKYLGKSLGADGLTGRQAYRVGEGFQPEPVRVEGLTWEEAEDVAAALLGTELARLEGFPLHENVEAWEGPPTWTITERRETWHH